MNEVYVSVVEMSRTYMLSQSPQHAEWRLIALSKTKTVAASCYFPRS